MLDCEWMDCLRLIHVMWSLKYYVLRTIPNHKPNRQRETVRAKKHPKQASGNRCDVRDRNVDPLSNADYVTTNANSSQGESQLYIFWKLTKRLWKWSWRTEVQRWDTCHELTELQLIGLFDRINLDSKSQIKNQLADILTKGSFTLDEWNHLLKLLNIMNFSTSSCSHLLSNGKHSVMSKSEQVRTFKEGPAVAKLKPMSLVCAGSLLSSKKNPLQIWSESNDLENEGGREFHLSKHRETVASWQYQNSKSRVGVP